MMYREIRNGKTMQFMSVSFLFSEVGINRVRTDRGVFHFFLFHLG